jgi:hypothetical protein
MNTPHRVAKAKVAKLNLAFRSKSRPDSEAFSPESGPSCFWPATLSSNVAASGAGTAV